MHLTYIAILGFGLRALANDVDHVARSEPGKIGRISVPAVRRDNPTSNTLLKRTHAEGLVSGSK